MIGRKQADDGHVAQQARHFDEDSHGAAGDPEAQTSLRGVTTDLEPGTQKIPKRIGSACRRLLSSDPAAKAPSGGVLAAGLRPAP